MGFSSKAETIEKNHNFVYQARAVREILAVPFWVLTVQISHIIEHSLIHNQSRN
jgi:hypothetical protein